MPTSTTFDLEVTGDAMQRWRFAYFDTTADVGGSAPNANPDNDSFDNDEEFIFGTNPTQADSGNLLSLTRDGDTITLNFSANEATNNWYEGKNRFYTVQYSEDLSSWPA